MQNFQFFKAYYLSFFDKKFYQDVAKNWRGTGFAYLFVLLMITWIPSMYLFHRVVSIWIADSAPQIVNQIPKVTIQKGVVSIDKPSPYFIKSTDSEVNLAIIDTSGKYTTLDNTPASILLTKDKLITKNESNEVNVYNLKSIKSFELTQAKIYKFFDNVKIWAAAIMYPICVFFSFIYRILWALLYAAMGSFIFARMLKVDLTFKQLLRIAVMAMTPAIIMLTLLEAMGIYFALQGIALLMLTVGYLYFGIAANKPLTNKT